MPNIIPTSATTPSSPLTDATTGVSNPTPGGNLGKDQFLQLLVAQLRYQDPMNPMNGDQLAANLAQFSGLEQLVNMNEKMDTQTTQYDTMLSAINNSVAMNAIGRTVVAAGSQFEITADASGTLTVPSQVFADIGADGDARLDILDAGGKVVGTQALGHLSAGDLQAFDPSQAAATLPAGSYTFRVTVNDLQGNPQSQTTYMSALVDGISYASTGAVLTSGPLTIPIGSVRRIAG